MIQLGIADAQQTQQALLKLLTSMDMRSGQFGNSIRDIALYTLGNLVKLTHVDTGAYRSSHYLEVLALSDEEIELAITVRDVLNPRTGISTLDYALVEELRGFDHNAYEQAFYGYTIPITEAFLRTGMLYMP